MSECRLSSIVGRGPLVALAVLLALGPAGSTACASAGRPDPVVLVGLDGFRWDFLDRGQTPNLMRLAARGVRAERLIPIFPTKTFPNHYSIVTGLYAEHHGIVSNNMYDPSLDARFSIADREAVADARWWEGEPIWVTAAKHGLTTATFFWPGSEAPIHGIRPTYWKAYDDSIPNGERVRQVLAWLDLPARQRPSFVTLYFSDVDDAVHRYGPDSEQASAAIVRVDHAVGELLDGLGQRGLTDRVNVVVVSDHGMAATSPERVILLDDYLSLADVEVVDWNPVVGLLPKAGRAEAVYRALAGANPHLTVYRREDIPERLHYRDHRRIPAIIGIAEEGWSVSSRAAFTARPDRHLGANHGYDNQVLSMGAIFIAAGPAFRTGLVVPPFENVHLYSLFCAVLGVAPAPNDGSLDAVRAMLR